MLPNPKCEACNGQGVSDGLQIGSGSANPCPKCWALLGKGLPLTTMTPQPTVPDLLYAAAVTYDERNKVYGDNYKRFGSILLQIFGGEIHITTEEEANRLGVFIQLISKLTRYGQSFKVGHRDSAHDAIVYAAMLQELNDANG